MSAECSKCGADIVYPEGTWPVGRCEVCDLRALFGNSRPDLPDLDELERLATKALATEGFYELLDRRRTTSEIHALARRALAEVRRVETLREALRELVDSHDALEGETVSFELQHAAVDRFEAAMTAARAALEGASDDACLS